MMVCVIIAGCLICIAIAALVYMLLTGNCIEGAWTPFENDGTPHFYLVFVAQLLLTFFVLCMASVFFLGLISRIIWG